MIMLKGHCRLVQVISEQRYVKAPRPDTDSDFAGCVLTRKRTTCAHLFHGVNMIKAGSWTQGTRSLSVAESEFYAGGSILLVKNVAKTLRFVFCSSAKSIMERDDGRDGFDICVVLCFGHKNVLVLVKPAPRNERVRTTRQTLARRQ